MLADTVVFTSPVAFKPYVGKPITAAILRGVMRVFEDFRYVREIADPGGRDHALVFEAGLAGVPGVTVMGCDFLHFDDAGLIDDFMVMVRPLSGAQALAEAMGAQFDRIRHEALELAEQFAGA
ncbi:nuclear transport factor 2 family protein [Mycobacterium alsense]|nr:nuclear transport factor 2 family protein [Mycobacterium alsense]